MSNKDQVASQLTKYVDLTGALYALITGSLIGFGYSLMTEADLDVKPAKIMKTVGIRSLGTGVFTLGVYLWSPYWMRESWYTAKK